MLAIILWAAMFVYRFALGSETFTRYVPAWMVFAMFPAALFLQGTLLKALKIDGDTPPVRDLRRAEGFFFGAAIAFLGEETASFAAQQKFAGLSVWTLTILLFYLTVLFALRAGLLKLSIEILKKVTKDHNWNIAAGYTDFFLIVAHGVALVIRSQTSRIHIAILVLVAASVRVAWSYIPEDRFLVIREFIQFLGERKLWWMAPIFIVMALLMVLVMLTQTTGGSFPFIYAVF